MWKRAFSPHSNATVQGGIIRMSFRNKILSICVGFNIPLEERFVPELF